MAGDALFERLEFLVPGVPQSAQKRRASRSKELWMDTVRDRAGQATGPDWNSLTTPLRVQIVHYHRLAEALDVDNMLKPINDALKNGVVFSDDRLITDLLGARRRLTEPFFLDGVDAALAEAILAGRDFVHVVIVPAPNPSEVLQ